MTFEQLLGAVGLTVRPYQRDLAERVSAHLATQAPVVVAVQAGAGVGKTWALAYAVVLAARARRRVVWSTHTIVLRAQVRSTLDQALRAAGLAVGGETRVAERRGRADFPSRSRALRLRHAVADRASSAETLGVLDALALWNGTLAEFEEAHGDLPVAQSLVCLTAACPQEEQRAYVAQRDAADGAAIVVQTHALTLLQARFGRLDADLVIFDEADTLPSVAASVVEVRRALDDLADLAERTGVDLAEDIAPLRDRASPDTPILWRDAAMAETATRIARHLLAAAPASDPALAEEVADAAADLRHFATVDQPRTGAALVNDEAAGAVLAVAAVDPATWLGHALADRQVVLMSATLGKHEDDEELAAACRRMGFWQVEHVAASPARFGTVEFRLADRRVPTPFQADGTPDPGFFDAAAAMVRQAASTGRTLVLCASYTDVEMLAPRLPATALLHRRGQRLAPLVDRFRDMPNGLLVTPGAWAGLDLPYLIDNVVILRLPVPRPDGLRHAILAQALERRGMAPGVAQDILASEGRADAMRRLTQGMGRGVRAADDACTVWIADSRFPLPANIVADLRRRQTQGPATGWQDMAKSIPLRFREGGARSAFGRAKIVALVDAFGGAAA